MKPVFFQGLTAPRPAPAAPKPGIRALRGRTLATMLAAALGLAGGAAWATDTVLPEPTLLPPAAQVQAVLAQLPAVRAASSGLALAEARGRRLEAGPHEWAANLAVQRRSETAGARSSDQELGLQTGLRWPGKRAVDQALADGERRQGLLQRADAWHEATRRLLNDWFDTLRALNTATLLEEQTQLLLRLQGITARRVLAGEAAVLERMAAEAETARWQATAVRARSQAQLLAQTLEGRYPGLPLPATLWPAAARLTSPASTTPLPDDEPLQAPLRRPPALQLAEAQAAQALTLAQRADLERRGDPTAGVRTVRERNGQDRVLGVFLSLPLGSAGRQADLDAARANADIAQAQWAQVRQRVETEAAQTARALRQSQAVQRQLQQALDSIRRTAALQLRAYELGESPLSDLLLAQRNALEAQQAADAAVLDTEHALARWLVDAQRLWPLPGDGDRP